MPIKFLVKFNFLRILFRFKLYSISESTHSDLVIFWPNNTYKLRSDTKLVNIKRMSPYFLSLHCSYGQSIHTNHTFDASLSLEIIKRELSRLSKNGLSYQQIGNNRWVFREKINNIQAEINMINLKNNRHDYLII